MVTVRRSDTTGRHCSEALWAERTNMRNENSSDMMTCEMNGYGWCGQTKAESPETRVASAPVYRHNRPTAQGDWS